MLYPYVVFCHSWLRWGVVVSVVLVTVRAGLGLRRSRPFTEVDRRLGKLALSLLDLQGVLGLTLYLFLSPFTPHSLEQLSKAMPIAALRFFAIEHVTGMILGLAAAHVGWARAKKAERDADRHRRILVGFTLAILAIGLSVPWPFFPYGRPLGRGFEGF